MRAIAFLFALSLALTSSASASPPTVKSGSVTYQGYLKDGTENFRGIPFAQPPVGDLRLQPPVPAKLNVSTFLATSEPRGCFGSLNSGNVNSATGVLSTVLGLLTSNVIQDVFGVFGLVNPLLGRSGGSSDPSEDCLQLNVVRPVGVKNDAKLPVVIAIYGGAFELGDTSMYDPIPLVTTSADEETPIIYVAGNYRVGALGFLNGPEVQKHGTANLGLLDQRLVMQWVQENIEAFGGDKTKVTIYGESAGSISISHHLVYQGSQSSKGLYRGAYMQSGSQYHLDKTEETGEAYNIMAKHSGCDKSSNSFRCLQTLPIAKFNDAMNQVPSLFSYTGVVLKFQPSVDGDFLPASPDVLVAQGRYNKDVRIINGDKDDEGTLLTLGAISNITDDKGFEAFVKNVMAPTIQDDQYQQLAKYYPQDPSKGSPFGTGTANQVNSQNKRVQAVFGDLIFQASRRFFIDRASKTQKVWSYIDVNGKNTPFLGAAHGTDIPYLYGTSTDRLTKEYRSRFISFVATGSPNPEGLPRWPAYNSKDRSILIFNANETKAGKDDERREEIGFLQKVSLGVEA